MFSITKRNNVPTWSIRVSWRPHVLLRERGETAGDLTRPDGRDRTHRRGGGDNKIRLAVAVVLAVTISLCHAIRNKKNKRKKKRNPVRDVKIS